MSDLELELETTGILDASSEKREMGYCKHCGNFTLMLNRKIYNYKDDRALLVEIIGEDGELAKEPYEELVWLIQECFVCKRLTLKERHLHFDFGDSSHFWMEDEILYPITKKLSKSIPSAVMSEYEVQPH